MFSGPATQSSCWFPVMCTCALMRAMSADATLFLVMTFLTPFPLMYFNCIGDGLSTCLSTALNLGDVHGSHNFSEGTPKFEKRYFLSIRNLGGPLARGSGDVGTGIGLALNTSMRSST